MLPWQRRVEKRGDAQGGVRLKLRNRANSERDLGEEEEDALPISVRRAGWTLSIAGFGITAFIIWTFIEADSSDIGVNGAKDEGGKGGLARKGLPSSPASRFWHTIWHGKPLVNVTEEQASTHAMLSEIMAECHSENWKHAHLLDVKLELRWGTGDIAVHRNIQLLTPGRQLGSVAVSGVFYFSFFILINAPTISFLIQNTLRMRIKRPM
jgi:hypothetical protein